ncbi:MAG: YdcH family protein [Burkholderiales bacterium]
MSIGPDLPSELRAAYEVRLAELVLEHRDLDKAIRELQLSPGYDELALKRMKKRKLLLKDQIVLIERQLDPDILA